MKKSFLVIFVLMARLCAFAQQPITIPSYFDSTLVHPPVGIDKAQIYLDKGEDEMKITSFIVSK